MYFDPDPGSDIVLQFVVGTAQTRVGCTVRDISRHLKSI